MNDGLVYRCPRRAEIGKFGVRPLTLQNIDGRHWFAALLIGDCPFDYRPVHPTGGALLGLVDNILETPIDDRFQGVEFLLRFFWWCFASSSPMSVASASLALTARPRAPLKAL